MYAQTYTLGRQWYTRCATAYIGKMTKINYIKAGVLNMLPLGWFWSMQQFYPVHRAEKSGVAQVGAGLTLDFKLQTYSGNVWCWCGWEQGTDV